MVSFPTGMIGRAVIDGSAKGRGFALPGLQGLVVEVLILPVAGKSGFLALSALARTSFPVLRFARHCREIALPG